MIVENVLEGLCAAHPLEKWACKTSCSDWEILKHQSRKTIVIKISFTEKQEKSMI
jgi:hypothetical protein